MKIRLALIESQTLVRYGLRELIARHSDIEIVAECATAAEAPRVLSMTNPDVVTVAVKLKDGNGLRLARELRDRHADLGIVILTSQGEDDVLFRAMETGVSAFVAKTAPVEEVLAAIRHSAVAASSFTASGLATALSRRRETTDRLTLSPREIEVLSLLRDGLSVPAIAVQMYISYSTAKTYVARLYQKLGAANRSQALMVAVQHGLVSCGPEAYRTAAMGGTLTAMTAQLRLAPYSDVADKTAGHVSGRRSRVPPPGERHQAAADQFEAVEEPRDFRLAARPELHSRPLVVPLGRFRYRLGRDVARAMPDHHIAARWQGIDQPGQDRVRVLGIRDEVQHANEQDGDRLAEVQGPRRFRKDHIGVPHVG